MPIDRECVVEMHDPSEETGITTFPPVRDGVFFDVDLPDGREVLLALTPRQAVNLSVGLKAAAEKIWEAKPELRPEPPFDRGGGYQVSQDPSPPGTLRFVWHGPDGVHPEIYRDINMAEGTTSS